MAKQQAGATRCYDGAGKVSWRGWAWNQIARRLAVQNRNTSESRVMYLSGPDNNDVPHAERHGFTRGNLIAVDSWKENVRRARRDGCLGVHGRIEYVLPVWQKPLDGVLFDLCAGITRPTNTVVAQLLHSVAIKKGTVVIINLLRGRDALPSLSGLDHEDWMCSEWVWRRKRFIDTGSKKSIGRHRGKMAYALLHTFAMLRDAEDAGVTLPPNIAPFVSNGLEATWTYARPSYSTYHTDRNAHFDSGAFFWPFVNCSVYDLDAAKHERRFKATKMKIAAGRAVSTRASQ